MTPDYVPTLPELQSYSDKALPGLSFANGDTADLFFYPEGSSFIPDQVLVARCATGEAFKRNAAFLAACVNYVRKVVLPNFQTGKTATARPAILFDVEAARANEWCWYVVDSPDDDGKPDPRAVQRNGEWRIYFESAPHILAELGIDAPGNLEAVLRRDLVEIATLNEIEAARQDWHQTTIEIDDGAEVSRADGIAWVAGWVMVKDRTR